MGFFEQRLENCIFRDQELEKRRGGNKKLEGVPNTPLLVIGRDKEYNVELGVEDRLPEWELKTTRGKMARAYYWPTTTIQ